VDLRSPRVTVASGISAPSATISTPESANWPDETRYWTAPPVALPAFRRIWSVMNWLSRKLMIRSGTMSGFARRALTLSAC
jgi:hypothetical protein